MSRLCAALISSVPLMSSSPTLSRPTRGSLDAVQVRCDHRAHHRELHEVIVVAVGVGAEVEHHGVAARRGHGRDDGGTVDARHHAEHETGGCEQRAGIAGRHARRRLALFDEVDRDAHRRVLLAAERVLRTLVHGDDFGRLDETTAVVVECGAEQRTHDFAATDDDQSQVGCGREDIECRGNGDFSAVVTAHRVHGYGQAGGHARARRDRITPGLRRQPASRSPSCRGRNRRR